MGETRKRALLVFAKAPIAGHAKTRLIPKLGSQGAAELHAQLVLHTLDNLVNPDSWDTLLWCAGNVDHIFFHQCNLDFDIKLFCQQGDDLGQRMFHAVKTSLQNYDEICIVGTDCPALNENSIVKAYQALNDVDVVFNPAEDGGYVLIATNKIDEGLFEHVHWGTDQVMKESQKNIERMKWNSTCLDTLWDVDVPDDLQQLNRVFPGQFKMDLARTKN